MVLCILLMSIGLWNATINLAEKAFYGTAYLLSLFAAITVQKNTATRSTRTRPASPQSNDSGSVLKPILKPSLNSDRERIARSWSVLLS